MQSLGVSLGCSAIGLAFALAASAAVTTFILAIASSTYARRVRAAARSPLTGLSASGDWTSPAISAASGRVSWLGGLEK